MSKIKELTTNNEKSNPLLIRLILLFYLILVISLFTFNMYCLSVYPIKFFMALLFLFLNMMASLNIIGKSKQYLAQMKFPYYVGMVVYVVFYTVINICTWSLLYSLTWGMYLILNLVIVFMYETAVITTDFFAKRNGR